MVVRQQVLEIYASADNQVSIGFGTGDTLYYKDSPSVSSASHDGTLTTNQSVTITEPTWIVSAGRSYISTSDLTLSQGLTPYAETILASGSASATRTVLGLGTIATQDASNVAVTGGSVTGVTDIAVADGGTGGSTAATARSNLGVGDVEFSTVTTASTAAAATTFTVRASSPPSYGMVAIEPFSTNCEVRQISSVSGSTVTVAALSNAHSSGVRALFFQSNTVPAGWWGAKGDASTDDILALQAAVRSINDGSLVQTLSSLALHGAGRVYRISGPLMLPNHTKLVDFNIWARSNYGPADDNGAMLMSFRGTVRTFTATAADDTFTISGNHGLGTSDQVVFKGTSLPTGITGGVPYWVKTAPTTTTITVSATSGGATINLTADGSGDMYPSPQAECRLYMRDVLIDGQSIAHNGLRADLQQPAFFENLRISGTTKKALWISGQQGVFFNTELLDAEIGLALDNAKFFWFFGFDSEQCTVAQVQVLNAAEGFQGGNAYACAFDGVHMEIASAWGIILHGLCDTLTFDNVYFANAGGQLLQAVTGDSHGAGYTFRNVHLNVTAGTTLIDDQDRGLTRTALHGSALIGHYQAEPSLQSGAVNDEARIEYPGLGGGYLRFGGQNNGAPRMAHRSDSSQTASLEVWRNAAGTDKFWVNQNAQPIYALNAAPADGDLAANQMAIWFDPTNGASALKIKGKSANGTVVTGTVSLS